jgi:hypothetical protein
MEEKDDEGKKARRGKIRTTNRRQIEAEDIGSIKIDSC